MLMRVQNCSIGKIFNSQNAQKDNYSQAVMSHPADSFSFQRKDPQEALKISRETAISLLEKIGEKFKGKEVSEIIGNDALFRRHKDRPNADSLFKIIPGGSAIELVHATKPQEQFTVILGHMGVFQNRTFFIVNKSGSVKTGTGFINGPEKFKIVKDEKELLKLKAYINKVLDAVKELLAAKAT